MAAKFVMGTVKELELAGTSNAVTVGFVLSGPGRLSVIWAVKLAETFPAASLAQAYKVFAPDFVVARKIKLVGGVALQLAEDAGGFVAVLVTM